MSRLVVCESRGFFIIDALTPGCMIWMRKALTQLGHLMALCVKRPPPMGIAILQHGGRNQTTKLQIMLRPGSVFQLKEYISCIARLTGTASSPADVADGKTIGVAIKTMLEHMMSLPGGEVCQNHLFTISSSFTTHPVLQKVMQVCGLQLGAWLHFLQLSGPDAEAASSNTDAFGQCVRAAAPRATFDHFTADCEAVADLLCQTWLRDLMANINSSSSNDNNSHGSAAAQQPDMLLHLGDLTLPCQLQQHILQLEPLLLHARLCPCHNIPMQPPIGSTVALQAAAGAASDAATAAGLLALPETVPWTCTISCQSILQPVSSCQSNSGVIQLGRHTQLRTLSQQQQVESGNTTAAAAQRSTLPCALAMPAGQACAITARHVVPLSQIDSMMLYGMPMVAVPIQSKGAGGSDVAAAAGVVGISVMDLQCANSMAEDSMMLMKSLCQLLLEQQAVLLAASNHDITRRIQQPLQQWYMLQPAADGCSLLLRYMASREQLLPPRGYNTNMAGVQEETQLVLLDAEHLNTVRSSLQALGLKNLDAQAEPWQVSTPAAGVAADKGQLKTGKDASSDKSMQLQVAGSSEAAGDPAAAGQRAHVAAAMDSSDAAGNSAAAVECANVNHAAATGKSAEAHEAGTDAAELHPLPLLSSRLHEWVASVLEHSVTYTPPVVSATPAVQAPQQQQQQDANAVSAAAAAAPPAAARTRKKRDSGQAAMAAGAAEFDGGSSKEFLQQRRRPPVHGVQAAAAAGGGAHCGLADGASSRQSAARNALQLSASSNKRQGT